jgi:hypothetical protein
MCHVLKGIDVFFPLNLWTELLSQYLGSRRVPPIRLFETDVVIWWYALLQVLKYQLTLHLMKIEYSKSRTGVF